MASNLPSFSFGDEDRQTMPPVQERILELQDSPYNANTLSPLSARFPPMGNSSGSLNGPARSSHLSPFSGSFDSDSSTQPDSAKQPFNFTPQQYVVGRPAGTTLPSQQQQQQTELGRRRGHKYARSSVSHQIILSPTPRLPLQVPTSLPIPTFSEFRASMTSEQRTKWLLCFAQVVLAGWVQYSACESMAMTALSHLLFFDALSSMLFVAVGVGRNFEVWARSSLRHPFGLERAELVGGLAMSIVLLFMGLDIISHGLTHGLENLGGHESHHIHHEHAHKSNDGLNIPAVVAVFSTLVMATSLRKHSRSGSTSQSSTSGAASWLPTWLQDPAQVLILVSATSLATLPFLGVQPTTTPFTDNTLAFTLAASMIFLGARLCYTIGRILLMSYPAKLTNAGESDEVRDIVNELWDDDSVSEVDEAKIWMVHYGLCIANFKIKVRTKEAIERIRDKVSSLVNSRLAGENVGKGAVRWEISCAVSVYDERQLK